MLKLKRNFFLQYGIIGLNIEKIKINTKDLLHYYYKCYTAKWKRDTASAIYREERAHLYLRLFSTCEKTTGIYLISQTNKY